MKSLTKSLRASIQSNPSKFDVKNVPEVQKLFKELEELRVQVDENEKIESVNQTKKEETMRRIEQLFLEAELTKKENKEQVWMGNTTLNITNDYSKVDDYEHDEVKY